MITVNGTKIGASSMKKLWEYATAHTSHFPAQTISLDLSSYDYIAVKFKIRQQESNCATFFVAKDGYPYQVTYNWVNTTSDSATYPSKIAVRSFTCSDSGIVVSEGKINITTTDNQFIVPWSVYGIQVV